MGTEAKQVEQMAMRLSAVEKARLVDRLIASLDRPDGKTDELWKKEVEDRIEAYRAGRMKSVSLGEVLARYGMKRR